MGNKRHTKFTNNMGNQLSMFDKKRFSAPRVMNFALHTTPDFKELANQDWIMFGSNNNYPGYLIKLFNSSAKHNAIVNAKVNYTTGAGWEFENKELANPKSSVIIDNINPDGESLKDVSFKCDMDLEIFGGFYCEVIWNKTGKKIASIKHIDFTKVRSNKDNSIFFYTANWFDKNGKPLRSPEDNDDWKEFLAFDPNKNRGRQILCYKSYRPSMQTYAIPEYIGAVEYIETDTLISNHCYNDTKNGFVGNTIINFLNGVPEEDEKQAEIEEDIRAKFTGSDGQRLLLNFSDGKDRAAFVEHLTLPDIFKRMTDLAKSIEQEILTGHRVTSGMLVGIKTEGQLGGRTEILESYELFKNTYIQPKQRILQEFFNYLLSFNQVDKVVLKECPPIGLFFGENTLLQIADKDELRDMQGLSKKEAPVKTQAQITLDAIQGLSPLVANKVLNSLTTNQIIGLVGLPSIPGGDVVPAPEKVAGKFSCYHSKVMNQFKTLGSPRSEFNIVKKRFVSFEKVEDAAENEKFLAQQNFAQYNSLERSILDLLSKDELMSVDQLSKALKRPKPEIETAIKSLVKSKAISAGTMKSGGDKIPSYTVNEIGREAITEAPAKTDDIFVLYSYEVVPGMGKPIIDATRDFCRELIELDRLYSRDDIEKITTQEGYNVFEMRGGWMTKKGTDVHVPHCRHLWQQNIVTKK